MSVRKGIILAGWIRDSLVSDYSSRYPKQLLPIYDKPDDLLSAQCADVGREFEMCWSSLRRRIRRALSTTTRGWFGLGNEISEYIVQPNPEDWLEVFILGSQLLARITARWFWVTISSSVTNSPSYCKPLPAKLLHAAVKRCGNTS